MPQCCFAGCHNRTDDGKGLSFFRFPRKDLQRTKAWVEACGRSHFYPSEHSRVCSAHFMPDDFDGPQEIVKDFPANLQRRLRLKDHAIPQTSTGVPTRVRRKVEVLTRPANTTGPVTIAPVPAVAAQAIASIITTTTTTTSSTASVVPKVAPAQLIQAPKIVAASSGSVNPQPAVFSVPGTNQYFIRIASQPTVVTAASSSTATICSPTTSVGSSALTTSTTG